MTYFGQKLLKAIRPNTKLAQDVRILRVTYVYKDQASFEAEMARRRRYSK